MNKKAVIFCIITGMLCFFLGYIFPEVFIWAKNYKHLSGDFEVKLTDDYRIFRASSSEIVIAKTKGEVIVSSLLRQIYKNDDYIIGFIEPEIDMDYKYNDTGYFVLNTKNGLCKKNMNKMEFQSYLKECGFKDMPKLILLEDYLKQIGEKAIERF